MTMSHNFANAIRHATTAMFFALSTSCAGAFAMPSGSLPDTLAVDLHEIDVTALKSGTNLRSGIWREN